MNIAILGYAAQGSSTLDYWHSDDNQITICDQNENLEIPDGFVARLGKDCLKDLDEFDILVRTPGLHPRDIVAANSEAILHKVTTNTNEFMKVCPTKNIIGVTGTKGKGTTSTLIAKMLEAAGKKVHLGGNIGTPPLDLLKENIQPDDWVVLELANFQTIDLKYSPKIAVCLMVVPEHLDWHSDFEEYIAAKQQLFINQETNDIAIYYAENENSLSIADASQGKLIPYYEKPGAVISGGIISIDGHEICKTKELKLLGKHNWQNVCAAITAVWQVTQNIEAIRLVAISFTGLEHRLEFVREFEGVRYYDDSFGTTPETAIVAMEAFKEPKIVILGGSDKGVRYHQLAKAVVSNNARHVVAIGDTAEAILHELAALKKEHVTSTLLKGQVGMDEIVAAARSQAKPGDIVLLSTGCASFGLFKNYKDRGEQFSRAVQVLV